MIKHPWENLLILEEGPLPRCECCDMFVSHVALLKAKRATEEDSRKAREVVFAIR
jgi:hypothetical protein